MLLVIKCSVGVGLARTWLQNQRSLDKWGPIVNGQLHTRKKGL